MLVVALPNLHEQPLTTLSKSLFLFGWTQCFNSITNISASFGEDGLVALHKIQMVHTAIPYQVLL